MAGNGHLARSGRAFGQAARARARVARTGPGSALPHSPGPPLDVVLVEQPQEFPHGLDVPRGVVVEPADATPVGPAFRALRDAESFFIEVQASSMLVVSTSVCEVAGEGLELAEA